MAHSLSAQKRVRQNEKRRLRNQSRRSTLKTRLRACSDALSRGDLPAAERAFLAACKLLDREASRGLIHRNEAARRKSRLMTRINAARRGSAPAS